ALTHPGFLGLLGDRLVGEHPDPDLAAALDEARHRDTGRLDLARRQPARLQRLQPVVPEGHIGPAPGLAPHAPALHLAVLDLLRHQHGSCFLRPAACTARPSLPSRPGSTPRGPEFLFTSEPWHQALALVQPGLD